MWLDWVILMASFCLARAANFLQVGILLIQLAFHFGLLQALPLNLMQGLQNEVFNPRTANSQDTFLHLDVSVPTSSYFRISFARAMLISFQEVQQPSLSNDG